MSMHSLPFASLAFIALLSGCATVGRDTGDPAPRGCHALPEAKIGLQLYSFVRPLSGKGAEKTEISARLDAALRDAAAAGFRRIERFGGTFGLGAEAYKAALARAGLHAVASHDALDAAHLPQALGEARALGQDLIGSGDFGKPGLATLDDVLATAERLDRQGADAARHGLIFYVHNHAGEFTRRFAYNLDGDGVDETVTAWEIIAARTSPAHVRFEVDIYWAMKGLGSKAALLDFLKRYRSRIVLLHIKDMAADGSITDLGRGTIDWPAVYRAAGPGIAYYLWEYDAAPDPAASARTAFAFMRCRQAP